MKKQRDKNSMDNEFDYKSEYIRLWNAAEQLLDNVDLENRIVTSWAAMSVLKNAVDYGREHNQPGRERGNPPTLRTRETPPLGKPDGAGR